MKYFFTTVILWAIILMPQINAQIQVEDTLRIINRDILYAELIDDDIHELKTNPIYKELISSFKAHLESIQSEIPEYSNFKIIYIKDHKLRIEEITGIVKYKVEEGIIKDSYSENIALLQHNELSIQLFFNEIEELFMMDYEQIISNALSNLKKRKKILSPWTRNIIDNYYFSYSENKLTKIADTNKLKNKFVVVLNASIGLFKNEPIYEYTLGPGYKFGNKNQYLVYTFIGQNHFFDKEVDRNKIANLYGLAFKFSKYASAHIAFPIKNENHYKDVILRYGVTTYPYQGLSISTFFYAEKHLSDYYPSISIGYGF